MRFSWPFPTALILALLTAFTLPLPGNAEEVAREVSADFAKVSGTNNHFESVCVGAGRAGELLRKTTLDHLKEVHEACGFQYVRFHGVLHDEMAVYSEDGKGAPVYNFQYVDLVYDAILDAGMKPFVELGFMPTALASGEQNVFWWKSNVTPPKDYAKWEALIRAFTQHMEDRYGRAEVKTWYFEVWNEPNHPAFFSAKQPEYFKMYTAAVHAIKSVCPDYRVGGPATAADAWVPDLINYCKTTETPLDFISTHTYGVKGDFDADGKKTLFLMKGEDVIAGSIAKVKKEIEASPMPNLPLHYTEWSSSYSSRDPVHDSYLQSAYIVNTIKRSIGLAQSMSYWTFTDVFEENGPPPTPFHGGFGLINLQGLRKPAFYAFKYLHDLGNEMLDCADTHATICRSSAGIQALVWDYTAPTQDAGNSVYFKRDLPSKPVAPLKLTINDLPPGHYKLQVFGTGYRRNDVYADFMDIGSPDAPSREQVKSLALKSNNTPLESENVTVTKSKSFTHKLLLRENDVYFVSLQRIK